MSSVEAALPAVSDAHTVFLVTNFWETMNKDTEVAQGKAVTDACKQAGVQHLIFSSLRNVTEISSGRLPNVTHFDGKAEIEAYIRASGISSTFVLAGLFMSNFFQFFNKQADTYTLAWPVNLEKAQVPLFDAAEDTGMFFLCTPYPMGCADLLDHVGKFVKPAISTFPATVGQRILAATEYYSPQRIVDEFREITGYMAQAVQIPSETFKSFLPTPVAQEMLENIQLLEDPGYFAGEPLDKSLALLDEKPTLWKEFVERNKEKF